MDGKGNEYTGFSEYAFPMRETFKSDPENHQCNCSLSAAGLLGPAFDCRMSGPHAENVGHAL